MISLIHFPSSVILSKLRCGGVGWWSCSPLNRRFDVSVPKLSLCEPEAFNKIPVSSTQLGEINKVVFDIACGIDDFSSERTLSEQLLTYKAITGALQTVKIARRFACANELRKGHFGKSE